MSKWIWWQCYLIKECYFKYNDNAVEKSNITKFGERVSVLLESNNFRT